MVFLDIETTGTDKDQDKILEIAIIKTDKLYNIIDTFETLINPESAINSFITELTGIDENMIINSPRIDEVKDIIQNLCSNETIIGHNISFDVDFLIKKGINISNYYLVDTYFLSHIAFNNLFNYSQEFIANHLGLLYTAHRAMADTQINYQIFLQIIDKLKQFDKRKIKQIIKILEKYEPYTGYKNIFSYIIQSSKHKTNNKYNIDNNTNNHIKTNNEGNKSNTYLYVDDNLFNNIYNNLTQNSNDKVIIYETSDIYTKEIIDRIINKGTKKTLIIDENQSLIDIYTKANNIQYLNHLSIYKINSVIKKLKKSILNNIEIQLLIKLILLNDYITDTKHIFNIKLTHDELNKLNNLLNNKSNISLNSKMLNEIKKADILIAKYDTILTKNNILDLFDNIIILNIDELFNYGIIYTKYNNDFDNIKNNINKIQNITSINIFLNKFKKIIHESFMLSKSTNIIIYDDMLDTYKNYIKEKIQHLYTEYTNIFKKVKNLYILYNVIINAKKIFTIENNNNNKLSYSIYTKNPLYNFNRNIKSSKKIIGFSNAISFDKIDIRYKKYPYLQIKTNNTININQMTDVPNDNIKDILHRYLCNLITLLSEKYNNILILFNQKYDIKATYNILTTKKEELQYSFFAQGIYGAISKHQLHMLKNVNKKNVLMMTYDYFIHQKWEDIFDIYIMYKLPVNMMYYTYYKIWTKENKIPFDEFIDQQKILYTKKIFDIISSKKTPNIFSTDLLLKENIQLIKKNFYSNISYNEISLRDITKN